MDPPFLSHLSHIPLLIALLISQFPNITKDSPNKHAATLGFANSAVSAVPDDH